MKMSLLNLGEVVLAAGVGMGLVRACHSGQSIGSLNAIYVVEPFLAGVAVVEAISLGVERSREPAGRPWGIGRWTWMITGLYVVIDVTMDNAWKGLMAWRLGNGILIDQSPWNFVRGPILFHNQMCWVLLASWAVNAISGSWHDPKPDAREISGRIYSILIILWGVAYRAVFAEEFTP